MFRKEKQGCQNDTACRVGIQIHVGVSRDFLLPSGEVYALHVGRMAPRVGARFRAEMLR
jgi:hypothetical protein